MASLEYLGTISTGARHIVRPHITPIPTTDDPISVPASVHDTIANGRGFLARIFGDSMQPSILDYDVAVVIQQAPTDNDIVVVRTAKPHPVYQDITACVWRYQHGILTKDNSHYRTQRPVAPGDIMGIVTRVIPRERRNKHEHHARIQEHRAIEQSLGLRKARNMGFHTNATRDALLRVLNIPATELIRKRLPWGYFRATAKSDHPHIGIHAGDTLTINPTIEAHVGQRVIKQHDNGTMLIGILQRERLHEPTPGEFYIDVGNRRVYVSGRIPTSHTLGVIEHHERTIA